MRRGAGSVYFDIDHDGFAERTGWVGERRRLARPRPQRQRQDRRHLRNVRQRHDARIQACCRRSTATADKKITSADTAFGSLRIWRDLDGDGVTDTGELMTLAQAGITEISLSSARRRSASMPRQHHPRRGDLHAQRRLHGNDRRRRARQQPDRLAAISATIPSRPRPRRLPNSRATATCRTSRVAMTQDAALLDMVGDFSEPGGEHELGRAEGRRRGHPAALGRRRHGAPAAMAKAFDRRSWPSWRSTSASELTPRDANGQPSDHQRRRAGRELERTWSTRRPSALPRRGRGRASSAIRRYDIANDHFVAADRLDIGRRYRGGDQPAVVQHAGNGARRSGTRSWGPELAQFSDSLIRPTAMPMRTDFAVAEPGACARRACSPL